MKLKLIFLLLFFLCSLASSPHIAEAKWWGAIFKDEMYEAIKDGKEDRVKQYLKLGANSNEYFYDNSTLVGTSFLGHASHNGHYNIAELLIQKGAKVNYASNGAYRYKWTPLHFAAKNGYSDIVNLLIKHGAEVNVKTYYDHSTPLHFAAINGDLSSVKLLIEKGAKVNAKREGITALHYAADLGNLEIVQFLVKNGADNLETALLIAANRKDLKMVQFLIENGADYQVTNKKNNRPIDLAYKQAKSTGDCRCYHYLAELEGLKDCCPSSCCQKQVTSKSS